MNAAPSLPQSLAPLDAGRVATLEWKQPRRGRREWELVADGEVVAKIAWRARWRGGWVAQAGGPSWRIVHGFLGRCTIARDGDATPVATSQRRGFRTLEIQRAAGETLFWRHTGFFRSDLRLENREGFPLFTLQRRRGFLRQEGRVVLEDAGRGLKDLVPLVLLCWTVALLHAGAHSH